MDNLAMTLFGATLTFGRLGRDLPRRTALIVAILAANLPDIDILYFLVGGPDAFVYRHATWTHSLVALAVLPLVIAGITSLASRLRFVPLLMLAGAAMVGHLALDMAGSWGIAPLTPFSTLRIGAGWVYSTDLYVWALLSLPLWLPRFAGVPAERVSVIALGLVVAWIGLLGGLSGFARAKAEAVAEAAGLNPSDVRVYASPFLPTRWNGLVSDGAHVAQIRVSLTGESVLESVHLRNLEHPAVRLAVATDAGSRYLNWAAMPVAEVICLSEPGERPKGKKAGTPGRLAVRFADLRFADPWLERKVGELRFDVEYQNRYTVPMRVTGSAWVTPWKRDAPADVPACKDAPIEPRPPLVAGDEDSSLEGNESATPADPQ